MQSLIPIERAEDIPSIYRDTPIGELLTYHNLGRPFETYSSAQLLIGMCMDNRKHLHIPDNFAFIIRAGGANLRYSEFKVSFAIAVGGVRCIALIGHNRCNMVGIANRKEQFVEGMVRGAGWDRQQATEHFDQFAPMFEIGNEIEFVRSEVQRLRRRYPAILIAPMLYSVDDTKLSLIAES